jgi:isopropylmalate/homocitrate/citramalate synthase
MSVRVVEVGPRDGLQNEPAPIPAAAKIAFVEALVEAGLRDVEVTSFVRPDRVPQLADAAEVFAGIARRPDVRYWALVPNAKGLAGALSCGVRHVAVFTAATDGFNRANTGSDVRESLARLGTVIGDAKRAGLGVRGYVSTVFGCPYEGDVEPAAGARVARALLDAGVDEVSLGDTIGVAAPRDVDSVLDACEACGIPVEAIGLHFHDTRGTALANVHAGLRRGVRTFDSSAGGLGGCPFAPGAAGNLATEDLLYFLERMGVETGVSLAGVARASGAVGKVLGKALPSRARAAWAASARG